MMSEDSKNIIQYFSGNTSYLSIDEYEDFNKLKFINAMTEISAISEIPEEELEEYIKFAKNISNNTELSFTFSKYYFKKKKIGKRIKRMAYFNESFLALEQLLKQRNKKMEYSFQVKYGDDK